jgi:hypothetical protein
VSTTTELESQYRQACAAYLAPYGYGWNKIHRRFDKQLSQHSDESFIFVSVTQRGGGYFAVHFPAQVRFGAIEEARNRFKVWPATLSAKQIQSAKAVSATLVQAYPRELGSNSAIDISPNSVSDEKPDAIHRILDCQLSWCSRFSTIEQALTALESASLADWPVPLPVQRYEVLASIYFLARDKPALERLLQTTHSNNRKGTLSTAERFVEDVLQSPELSGIAPMI